MTGNERRRWLGTDDEEDEDDGGVVAVVVQPTGLTRKTKAQARSLSAPLVSTLVGSSGVYPLDSRLVSQAPIDGKSWTQPRSPSITHLSTHAICEKK